MTNSILWDYFLANAIKLFIKNKSKTLTDIAANLFFNLDRHLIQSIVIYDTTDLCNFSVKLNKK